MYGKSLLILHIMFAVYSLLGIAAKMAAREVFLSPAFCMYYAVILSALVLYAFMWQQILERIPLTTAYMNKAVVIVWGMIWGHLVLGEEITVGKIIGAGLVVAGTILFVGSGEEA